MRRPKGTRPIGAENAGCASSRGFTIVELLIAIFITGIVAAALYSLYNTFFRQTNIQDMMVEAQQNARVGIDTMERELLNAGYASATADIITEATENSIEFIYTDPETDTTVSATAGKRLKVKYSLQTTGGVQYLVRKADNLTDSATGTTEQVIPYTQGLTITYYDIDGNQIASTSIDDAGEQSTRNTVKFITVSLTTQTKSNIPGTSSAKTNTVETHVRLRNIGVGQTASDTTAPAAPAGLQVRDPGTCGRLKLKWTQNTEGDISGYRVYYGTASGSYTGIINIPLTVMSGSTYSCFQVSSSVECTVFPSNPSLSYTASNAAAGSETVYYVAVKAYDNSLNYSDYSSEVYGNPATSNATYDSGSDDSTINPVKPVAVTGLTGANGSTDGTVALSWTAYDTTTYPDVTGFRVYRSASAFTSYPIDPTAAGIDWIAGEPGSGKPEITASATSYTDLGPSLSGCSTYYYAIAPVNCDATLIPDNGGDTNAKKYIQTDYGATCGDGSTACSAGTGFASVAGSDTAPQESVAPGTPAINAAAGWKRVALSLTQPSDADLSQTCVYVNESSTYPALLTDTGSYPKVNGCYQVNTTSTPSARLVPDSAGIFTSSELAQSQSTSFWHDSMTQESPSSPSLQEVGTYSYRAVSFDLCGNGSSITGAQATTVLCGEDPASGEKPPAVAGASASCCSNPVALTWTQVSSDTSQPSSITNPYDLAGYRIFRSTSADFATSTMISGTAPYWGGSYNDTTVTDGGTYYYRIVTTDCPYEKNDPSEATIRADMISGYLNSVLVGPIKPGQIDRDEKCVGSGACTKDDHREVLTGVDISNSSGTGDNSTTPKSSFYHNTVTMFLSNTSAGTMTITAASVSWGNSSAYLREIKAGGGRSGMGAQATSIDATATASVTGNDPYTRAVSNVTLSSATIPAGARYVPMTFEFKDVSETSNINMRDDQLLITLTIRNDTTSTTSCVSYMTVSQAEEGVFVPHGPRVSSTQQNKPSSPTYGYAVPGSTGLNTVPSGSDGSIVVSSGLNVTISTSVTGDTTDETTGSKVAISSAKLYYKVTAKTTTTAPASGFTTVSMTNASGDIWSATIPANDGFRIWYYIVATDADGNWERDPEIDSGAYVYDQETFDACDVTPSAPTTLVATGDATSAALTWAAPTTYTNSATIDTGADPIKYRVYRGGTLIASDIAVLNYTDSGLSAGVYRYTVRATNSCTSPGPNVSDDSNTAASCVGATGQATITVSPASIYRGESYTVTIIDCLAIYDTYATTTETVNLTSGFTGFNNTSSAGGDSLAPTIAESGPATATFTTTITTTSSTTDSTKLLVGASDTITVAYPFASNTPQTVSVVVDPCTNTPNAPATITGSVTGQNITVSWGAVTQNTDSTAITDLAGYRVYEKVCRSTTQCTGANLYADWFLRTHTNSSTTSATVSADYGNINQRTYYFKVTAIDSCSTPVEGAASSEWNETN